jgi:hypothetical protein
MVGQLNPFATQLFGQLPQYTLGQGYGVAPSSIQPQQYAHPLQQVLQLLQIVPHQLQQLQQVQQLQQQHLQQLQYLMQIVPQQLQQIQQLIQFVPQQIQQLQHHLQAHQPFGQATGFWGSALSPQLTGSLGWSPAQGSHVM